MRAKLLLWLLALPLCLGACTKQDSSTREAEIERRVQERLDAEHVATEKQQLVQHEAALAEREKTLAAERASFASISAALPPSLAAPAPDETDTAPDDNAPSDNGSGSYYSASGALYPNEQLGYLAPDESDLDYYPYFGVSGIPIVTTFVPYGRFSNFYYRRGFHNNRGWPHRTYPPANFRQGFARGPSVTGPERNFGYHPSFNSAPSRPVIMHSHAATSTRAVQQRAR